MGCGGFEGVRVHWSEGDCDGVRMGVRVGVRCEL